MLATAVDDAIHTVRVMDVITIGSLDFTVIGDIATIRAIIIVIVVATIVIAAVI